MPFDTSQKSYQDLRSIISENSDSLVAWVGAGLSKPAGLPLWSELRKALIDECEGIIRSESDAEAGEKKRLLTRQAESENNLWISFLLISRVMGATTYQAAIRRAFKIADTAKVPEIYRQLWKLRLRGMINLNIDGLAMRAFTEVFENQIVNDFTGNRLGEYMHLLRSPKPWIANLHGELQSHSSWVFTHDELRQLFSNPAYDLFVKTVFAARTVVFIGISADDIAAGEHLQKLTKSGVDCGGHFWITENSSKREWAEASGLRQIYYSPANNHCELDELFADLSSFVSTDTEPTPVFSKASSHENLKLRSPDELEREPASEIRKVLNFHASRILEHTNSNTVQEFEDFATKYSEAIYRAWFVDTNPPKNIVLNYTLTEEIKEGAFGTVYRATDSSGRQYAVKVLHERVRRNREMLQSFRRGVSSMRILTASGVDGVVRYHDASEIPAMVVMDFVEGIDLVEATKKGILDDWHDLIRICKELTSVIRFSHRLPQRVLHRDIRPANVMLENCWGPNPNWEETKLWVLDFDLSYHLESYDVSVSAPGQANGFLAPEQVERQKGISTRNASVDSFGLGMTFFFLRTGVEPRFGQHRYGDWHQSLKIMAMNHSCKKWSSLPFRFSRLILNSTTERQETRLEVASIEDELLRLENALKDPKSVVSAEMLAEELASRVFNRDYEWDCDTFCATKSIGFLTFRISGDEKVHRLRVEFEWLQRGYVHFQDIKRWIPIAQNKALSLLRKGDWEANANYDTGQLRGWGTIDVLLLKEHFALHESILVQLLDALTFN